MLWRSFFCANLSQQLAGLFVCLLLAGCENEALTPHSNSAASASAGSPPVMLLAAASTADAVDELSQLFWRQYGVKVQVSSGPSSGLAQQIIAGAPADVFISANEKWAEEVEKRGLAADARCLLTNQLVLVVPRGNPANVFTPDDLSRDSVEKCALAGESVPAGMYADQALQSLGLEENLVSAGKIVRGHDVRVALGYVQRREADAGIVYATDARLADGVEVVYTFPAYLHAPIRYQVLLVKRRDAARASGDFFDFLLSDRADVVFGNHGFLRGDGASVANNGGR